MSDDLIQLEFPEADLRFRVDRGRRQISGMILPWGEAGISDGFRWRFTRGSIEIPANLDRVKLLQDHDPKLAVGKALSFDDREDGLHATFYVKRGAAGDEVLAAAEDGILDGFSVGPNVSSDGWRYNDAGDRVVHQGRLVETSITAFPAFDDARVASVIASRKGAEMSEKDDGTSKVDGGDGQKPTILENQGSAMQRFEADLTQRFEALTSKVEESAKTSGEAVSKAIGDAVTAAFGRLQDVDAFGRGAEAAARLRVISEPPVYRFDGDVHKPSLVRDSWNWHRNGDHEARDRLRKFTDQQADVIKFATVTTGSASAVIPPGYRPDLYVTQLMQGRPIVAHASRGTLTDATPFTIPKFGSVSGATGDHAEGVHPGSATLVLGTTVVQPGAISGTFELTREIADSSNPAIDAISMQAMRESWNQQTEAKAYTELNAEATGTQVENLNTVDLNALTGLAVKRARRLLARYPFLRFAAPSGAVMSQIVTKNFAEAEGSDGRPLLPSVGAQNTAGLGNAVQQGWFVDGLAFVPAWAVLETAGSDVALIVNSTDWWVWESSLLTFRFEEKMGPEKIELALFGYYATKVLRPSGIFAIRKTD